VALALGDEAVGGGAALGAGAPAGGSGSTGGAEAEVGAMADAAPVGVLATEDAGVPVVLAGELELPQPAASTAAVSESTQRVGANGTGGT
jgi:hypothetical protein